MGMLSFNLQAKAMAGMELATIPNQSEEITLIPLTALQTNGTSTFKRNRGANKVIIFLQAFSIFFLHLSLYRLIQISFL